MALTCPSCKEFILSARVIWGGESECPHCRRVLTCRKVEVGKLRLVLSGITLGPLVDRLLRQWMDEWVAVLCTILILVLLVVAWAALFFELEIVESPAREE